MKHPTNNEIWFAEQRDLAIEERDEQRALAAALAAEMEAIQSSAHMPDDYEYGLASWINQYLYAAYIGARMGPTAIQQIETGRLTFPNAPIYQERDRLAAEVERLGAVLKRRNQDYDEVFNDYEEMRAAWEAGAAVQAERDALRAQLAAGDNAIVALLEITCVYTEIDGTILKTDDGRPKLFRWDKKDSEPAFKILEQHGRLENLENGTFAALPAPTQE